MAQRSSKRHNALLNTIQDLRNAEQQTPGPPPQCLDNFRSAVDNKNRDAGLVVSNDLVIARREARGQERNEFGVNTQQCARVFAEEVLTHLPQGVTDYFQFKVRIQVKDFLP